MAENEVQQDQSREQESWIDGERERDVNSNGNGNGNESGRGNSLPLNN